MKTSTTLPPALLAEIRKYCPDMKPPYTPAKFLTSIRRVAGPRVEVYDDRDTGSYLASCEQGYRFDFDLHELVACYWNGMVTTVQRLEALVDLLGRLIKPGGYVPELCDDPSCDWCGRSEEASR